MYSRTLDGEILTLASSGWTYDRLFVLYDFETESMWYHLPGTEGLTCIAGDLEGNILDELPSTYGAWNRWLERNPDTKVYFNLRNRPVATRP